MVFQYCLLQRENQKVLLLKKKLENKPEIERIGKNARLWALKYIKDNPKNEIKFLDDFLKD